ncbi:MAG: extracellular solute-binding protein [Bdellovibrionota bacterium]
MNSFIKIFFISTFAAFFLLSSCTKNDNQQTIWIYTSLYKDTVNDLQPKLEKEFPGVKFQFYQAGSEEVAAKVQAEALTGKIQADLLISSDRFWYEDMGAKGSLLAYQSPGAEKVHSDFRHPEAFYTGVSLPVMVIAYNSEVVSEADVPKSFKSLADEKWKDKISMGSPLASGTAFTSVSFLEKKYGWDYFKSLRKNNFIAEGGNSGVIRRLQSKERPIGIVLLENVLRLKESDPRIKWLIPTDGAIIQTNVLAIVKKDKDQSLEKKVADWMYKAEGQQAMARSFMYPTVSDYGNPAGAPDLKVLLKTSPPWSRSFIDETLKSRDKIKDQFSKIIF